MFCVYHTRLCWCLSSLNLDLFGYRMDVASSVQSSFETQTRVCKTCGLEKTLDHFISLYTETTTHNCDYCRCRQRQQYKGRVYVIVIPSRSTAEKA